MHANQDLTLNESLLADKILQYNFFVGRTDDDDELIVILQ